MYQVLLPREIAEAVSTLQHQFGRGEKLGCFTWWEWKNELRCTKSNHFWVVFFIAIWCELSYAKIHQNSLVKSGRQKGWKSEFSQCDVLWADQLFSCSSARPS